MRGNRGRQGDGRAQWPLLLLLTSCLAASADQGKAALAADAGAPPEGGPKSSLLPQHQQALNDLSIQQIVDEFFSLKGLVIPEAWAVGCTTPWGAVLAEGASVDAYSQTGVSAQV